MLYLKKHKKGGKVVAEQQIFCAQEDLEASIEKVPEEDVIVENSDLPEMDDLESNMEETEESQQESGTQEAEDEEAKKGFFGKKKEKKEKKDKKDQQIEELNDRLKRNLAEFENFRKRNEKEKAIMYEVGAREVIEKILPIVDNFERGLASMPEEDKNKGFGEGMDKVYRQLVKILEDVGVRPIDAIGCEFNPDFHNAVMHVEDEEAGENIVIEEFQKGYTYRDTVIRYSMVKVAN